MQATRLFRFKVAAAIAVVTTACIGAAPDTVWEFALNACTKTIDLAMYVTELPYRIAKSIRTLPERIDPTCSECNKP
jgi:hypothetical protein